MLPFKILPKLLELFDEFCLKNMSTENSLILDLILVTVDMCTEKDLKQIDFVKISSSISQAILKNSGNAREYVKTIYINFLLVTTVT